jgi:hypothetical protein
MSAQSPSWNGAPVSSSTVTVPVLSVATADIAALAYSTPLMCVAAVCALGVLGMLIHHLVKSWKKYLDMF